MQEIVYLLLNGGDTADAQSREIDIRFPFMEGHRPGEEAQVDRLACMPGRRLIKSHLGPHFFEKALRESNAKFVICMRNIKDNLVSYYHFYRRDADMGNYQGSFGEYLEMFKQKKLIHGDWFDFNLAWWEKRNNPNILYLKFEDLCQDLEGQVRKIDAFLGTNSSDDVIKIVYENTMFDAMKNNPTLNRSHCMKNFMRKGKVGDWRGHFSMDESVALDDLYAKKMKNSGLTFQYDLQGQNSDTL